MMAGSDFLVDDDSLIHAHASIREGIEDMKAGRTYDAAEVLAELRARK